MQDFGKETKKAYFCVSNRLYLLVIRKKRAYIVIATLFYFMLSESFLRFIQIEFPDFWQNSAQKQASEFEKGAFEQMYVYFMTKEKKATTSQERLQAYQFYKQLRLQSTDDIKHYQALELAVGSAWADIRVAYKTAIKKYHPDRFANNPEKQKIAQVLAQKINEAYQYFEKKFLGN